jgi:hypothetical protein
MALPASPSQISFNDLRVELGISAQAPFSITTAATSGYVAINTSSPSFPNSSTPHAISEWYSYDHNATSCTALNGGASLRYSTVTPADPTICNSGGNEYTSNQVFYSNDCTDLASGCTVYATNTCTTTAYNAVTARYITVDATNLYYGLSAASVVNVDGACSD